MPLSPLLPGPLLGACTESLLLVLSAPHYWDVSNAFLHLYSNAVSWAREPHWAWEIPVSSHREQIWGRTLKESLSQHVRLQSWTLTRLYRKAPSRASPLREMPQAPGNGMRPIGGDQTHQNQGKETFLMADQTLEKRSPWQLLRTLWAYSTSVCSGLFSVLRSSIGPF